MERKDRPGKISSAGFENSMAGESDSLGFGEPLGEKGLLTESLLVDLFA